MSCFVMSAQSHAALANTLEYILNSGFNRFGFEAPESLHKALSDCRDRYGFYDSGAIFRRLYALNNAAYDERYKSDAHQANAEIPEMPIVPQLVEQRHYENYHENLRPWHYKFCKLLDCLIYQCSEDSTQNDPLLHALIDFSIIYKSFLVGNTEEYHSAPWGVL